MRFAFTQEQDMFRDAVRDLLADLCPPEAVRASWENADGRVPGLWSALGEMGVLAAMVPEADGGLGMTDVDVVRLLEEAGYAGVPEPLMEHATVAVPALAQAGSPLLAAAIAGESTVTIHLGIGGRFVLAGGQADAIVAERNGGLVVLDGAKMHGVESVDQSRRLVEIDEAGPEQPLVGADLELASDRAVLGTAAQCIGVARRLLDATVDYVGQRQQFGSPVGVNQSIKHHLANVRMGIEFAAPLVYRAAYSLARPDQHDASTRRRDVSMAKMQASDAVDRACRAALQCHGAIGYTFEYDLQLWLKRGWALSAAYGDAGHHRTEVGAALGLC